MTEDIIETDEYEKGKFRPAMRQSEPYKPPYKPPEIVYINKPKKENPPSSTSPKESYQKDLKRREAENNDILRKVRQRGMDHAFYVFDPEGKKVVDVARKTLDVIVDEASTPLDHRQTKNERIDALLLGTPLSPREELRLHTSIHDITTQFPGLLEQGGNVNHVVDSFKTKLGFIGRARSLEQTGLLTEGTIGFAKGRDFHSISIDQARKSFMDGWNATKNAVNNIGNKS